MKYKIIHLPFDKPLRDLTEKEARIFNEWFIKNVPERMSLLKKCIKSEDRKLFAKLDFSPESLVLLGKWFNEKISIRQMTNQEIKIEKISLGKFSNIVEPKKWVFTEETFSLFFDVGIYFGTVFTKKFKSVKWTYVTKPKRYVYRNWPILNGFDVEMEPIGLVTVFANKLCDHTCDYSRLKELYDIWEAKLKIKK